MRRPRPLDGVVLRPRLLSDATASRYPGDLLLHPWALVALTAVIVNDAYLKPTHPGLLSGKLSDVAGLAYFPLFVVAAAEGARRLGGATRWTVRRRWLFIVVALVGAAMAVIQVSPPAGEAYRTLVGIAAWPLQLPWSLARGGGIPVVERAALVQDASDLISLVALVIPVRIGRSVMGR